MLKELKKTPIILLGVVFIAIGFYCHMTLLQQESERSDI